eukprot:958868-Pyramimonas_sp.AAC.1
MGYDRALRSFTARSHARPIVTDFCQWGKPWRKRTHFGSAYLDDLTKLNRVCSGRGACSRTGRPRQHLEGAWPEGIRWIPLGTALPRSAGSFARFHIGLGSSR